MKKRIKISESVLRKIVKESLKTILTEDTRSKQARNRSKQVIRDFFGDASWLDTEFVHEDNPDHLSHLDYILWQFELEFYHDPHMRASAMMRLEPLFCRLALENGFQQASPDGEKLQRLQSLMFFIFNMSRAGKVDVSKISLDATYEMLEIEFGDELDRMDQDEDERIKNTQYEKNTDYEIIGPVDYETAHKYGNQSCPESKLCYTQSKSTWDQYTNNGANKVYILLRKGWKNIPPEHDDETESGYDTYGSSMIFVFINRRGKVVYCNTRWNHRANYAEGFSCDHALNKEGISKLIGVPFDQAFGLEEEETKPLLTGATTTVNLGLPSGTLWAACNIGANSEVEYGNYFAWGETEPKRDYSWRTYRFGTNSVSMRKYNDRDGRTELEPEDDAATKNMGSGWQLPSGEQIKELCSLESDWDSDYKGSGVAGRVFYGANGNTLFIPAAGYCFGTSVDYVGSVGYLWSRSLGTSSVVGGHGLRVSETNAVLNYDYRCSGFCARGVLSQG